VRGNQIIHEESAKVASSLGFPVGIAASTCVLASLSDALAITWEEGRSWMENIDAAAIAAVARTMGTASWVDDCIVVSM
jgi:hypothetical protein